MSTDFLMTQFRERHIPLPVLNVLRMPGELGPILHCRGELSTTTVGALEREIALLEPVGHAAVILNLAGCDFMDGEGVLAVHESARRLQEMGSQLIVVAGTGQPARLLRVTGIDQMIAVFPSEEAVMLALRGGGPPRPAPRGADARAMTLVLWRAIEGMLADAPVPDILYLLTGYTELCERADAAFRERSRALAGGAEILDPPMRRCQFCPLFQALGGRHQDIGCRSLTEPLIHALQRKDRRTARKLVSRAIRLLEEMPLPAEPAALAQ